MDYQIGYPVTVNDAAEYEFARDTIVDLFGADRFRERAQSEVRRRGHVLRPEGGPRRLPQPQRLRRPPTRDAAADNHSPLADFDDSVLPDAAALLAELAVRRLARAA